MHIAYPLVIAALVLLSGCVADRPHAMNESLDRTLMQLEKLERDARAGSGEAAMTLAIYYGFHEFDDAAERRWLERGAALRYFPAVESLGNILIESSNLQDQRKGRRLLRTLKKSNHAMQPTAGRPMPSFSIISTRPLQIKLVAASGGSALSR
jgi:hypothetical protein